jgi:hypothetical protein
MSEHFETNSIGSVVQINQKSIPILPFIQLHFDSAEEARTTFADELPGYI